MMSYNLNDEEMINDRHFSGAGALSSRNQLAGMGRSADDSGAGSGSEFPMHRDDRRIHEREMRERDARDPRERMDARDRREHYVGSNSRHFNNSYDNADLIREKEKERYAHRRDEYNYSPHRGGNRRVLNMNAM
jgi:hypothetical protein